MSEELKPCPFCGGEADVHYFAHDDSECTIMCSNPNCRASVSARSCGSMTTAYNRARKLWNRRAERTCRMIECLSEDTCTVHQELPGGGLAGTRYGYRQCSECGAFVFDCPTVRYCPSCGAKVVDE